MESAISALLAARQETRRRMGALRATGYGGYSLQINHKPSRDFVRRLEALRRSCDRVTHPLMD